MDLHVNGRCKNTLLTPPIVEPLKLAAVRDQSSAKIVKLVPKSQVILRWKIPGPVLRLGFVPSTPGSIRLNIGSAAISLRASFMLDSLQPT
jgi:hypothetical protein